MKQLGPTFGDELIAAGLAGLPIAWGTDGAFTGRERLTDAQRATLDAVIAAHDPEKRPRALLPKSLVTQRIIDAGKIAQAVTALMSQPALFARWVAPDHGQVYADDPDAVALITALGLDPDEVLAPTG